MHLASISCDLADLAVPQSPYHSQYSFSKRCQRQQQQYEDNDVSMYKIYFDFQDYGVMRHINIAHQRDFYKEKNQVAQTNDSYGSVWDQHRDEATSRWPIDPKLTLQREPNQVIISGPPHAACPIWYERLGCHMMDCSWWAAASCCRVAAARAVRPFIIRKC